jgi:hypothetical protein
MQQYPGIQSCPYCYQQGEKDTESQHVLFMYKEHVMSKTHTNYERDHQIALKRSVMINNIIKYLIQVRLKGFCHKDLYY